MRISVLLIIVAALAAPASAQDRLPNATLRTMLATVAAVEGSCRDVQVTPSFLQVMATFSDDVDRIMRSRAAADSVRSERDQIAGIIASVGCAKFVEVMNERARTFGFGMPMFVRD